MKGLLTSLLASAVLVATVVYAHAQSGTCTGSYNICLSRAKQRGDAAGISADKHREWRADCGAAKATCMQTGSWIHSTANITGLQKK